MAGYIHDPLQIINLIADNLRDRYKSGFPVLKEIIQNADDAGSTDEPIQLEFGLSQGISTVEHPLLQGPALYFLNNGTFSESDFKAIRSFGLNRKAIEQSSIGKFGLGMKSVFHFCEAFFFLAKNKDKKFAEILNPWSGGEDFTSFHDNWNTFTKADANLIYAHVQFVIKKMDLARGSFFLLWLPLRQKKHLLVEGKEVGSIISEFPGDDYQHLSFLFQQNLAQKIASLLPLLRRITSIRFWHANGSIATDLPHFQVSMKGTNRIGLADGQYQSKDLEGTVSYRFTEKENESYTLTYSGREQLLDLPELLALRNSPLWPKSYIRDDYGKSCEAPDKACQHCAVIFSRSNEKEHGKLTIRWAVFLPVDAAKEEIPCRGESCFRITLHGYFFIDAGRVGIEGLQEGGDRAGDALDPTNEVELRRLWNTQLARKGTLPLVLPALEAFVSKSRLSANDIWHLSEGIGESKLFRWHNKSICARFSWVCCLTRKGREWRVLVNDHEILPLPGPPFTTSERPWETFPKLQSLQDRGVALLLRDAPHLLGRHVPQWNEEMLLEVLHLRGSEVFTNQGCLDYLLLFLADTGIKPFLSIGTLQARLQHIANQAFIQIGIGLRQYRSKIQEFVSFISPERRYSLKPDAPLVIRELQHCKTSVLVLAHEFDSPRNLGNARLSLADAFILLEKLHDLIVRCEQQGGHENVKYCREIAREILQGQEEESRRILLEQSKNLKILEGYDCLRERFVALSPSDLRTRHEVGLLFLYSQGVNDQQRRGLAPKLQHSIMDTIVLVNSRTADLVIDKNNDLFPCQADTALDSLGSKTIPLQTVERRRQLLRDVAGADLEVSSRVRGLRYLLHGQVRYFDDVEETLWVSGYEQSPVWSKLWQQLESHHKDGWNLLDRTLVDEIPQKKWLKLSIREIKPDNILDELRLTGTENIGGAQFSRDERNAVLKELVTDEGLWKKLPFHETVNEDLVSITAGKAFLESDIVLPPELFQKLDIIKFSSDQTVKRQQKEWLAPLSEHDVIRIALQHEEPAKFWRLIMDHLVFANNYLLRDFCRNTAWLPDNDLISVKPSDVLCLKQIQDEVDRLLAVARGAFWSPGKLLVDLQRHPSFPLLQELYFAVDREGFEKLALLLGETHEYHVGIVRCQDDDFVDLARLCAQLPVHLRLPGWVLFSSALDLSQGMAKEHLLPEILKSIDLRRILDILRWLQEQHIKVGSDAKNDIVAAFNAYLAAAMSAELHIEDLASCLLLNREGFWKPAGELCAEVEGVDDAHLLDDIQKNILLPIICKSSEYENLRNAPFSTSVEESEIKQSSENLRKYFIPWEGLVPPELICALLTIFGNEKGISQLANQYQGRHSISWVRDQIPWNPMDCFGVTKESAWGQHKFVVGIHYDVEVRVYSILGYEIDIPIRKYFKNLIVGGIFCFPTGRFPATRVNLRSINPEEITPSERALLLKGTAEYLLSNSYNQKRVDLSKLWEELDRSEQLDIRIAQQLVLNHLPFYLRQLGVHKHPHLQGLLKQWDEAQYMQVEYYDSTEKREAYDADKRQVLEKIKELLKGDEQVQGVVLQAVRAKMKDFQYSPASIPFELFQNADDAVVELAIMKAYPKSPTEVGDEILPPHVRRFQVSEQGSSLLFVHWGRPINAVGSVDFPGRERGFHHDLEKMLVLSSSDKSSEGAVTGKFGLGFKSVLLACEKPRLLSGRLATEIIAGLCPIPLKDSAQLRSHLLKISPDRKWQGTLLELPLKDWKPQEIIRLFAGWAGVMTIFSKQIRQIDIHGDANLSFEWNPEKLYLNDDICLEIANLPLQESIRQGRLAMYFRLNGGGILLSLGSDGFRQLPAELPGIWVVAPTKEIEGLGLAVNCMFDLDAGRVRLAGNSDVNSQKAHKLGTAFGQGLRLLYGISVKKWDDLKSHLHFEDDLSLYDFWASFWKIISESLQIRGSEEVNCLLVHLFCGGNGLGYLITHEDAMPNGLWDDYRCLTKPEKVRNILKGSLAKSEVFREIIKWEFFRNVIGTPESVISDAVYVDAKNVLPALGKIRTQWRSVQLADVLRNFAETERQIAPDTATTLGRLLTTEDLKSEDFEKEREVIEQALQLFLFKTQAGSFQVADEILVLQTHKQANPDEAKRAAFATPEFILSDEYQGGGLNFFFSCRKEISIPMEMMVTWLLDAESDQQKSNGLRYLLNGVHGEKIAVLLRGKGFLGTWLVGLRPDSPCFHGWEHNDVAEILFRKLPPIDDLQRLHLGADGDEPFEFDGSFSMFDSKDVLQKIHAWWSVEKNRYQKTYESKIYPNMMPLSFEVNDVGEIDRQSWLTLFSLAHFHTMGRQSDAQHKGFIEKCLQKGWWDVFAADRPQEHSDEWMRVLEEFIEEQVDVSEYEHWMNRFPAIYKFSRWLEEYKDSILSVDFQSDKTDIASIFKSRVNAEFQGGGISAPPIDKSLGIGACFILRELMRWKVLKTKRAAPFCYVPTGKTRLFFTSIGCDTVTEDGGINNAREIHSFVCKHIGEENATFSDCYDMPILFLLEDQGLLNRLLIQ